MKKITTQIVTLLLVPILVISSLKAQTVSSTSSLSIFYPAGYDATQNTPSFAIQNEPAVNAGAQTGWKLNPVFSVSGSNTVAKVSCGTGVDFYGTGEVTGALRRNNTSITLWNTDNFNYASYGGQQLYQSHPWVMGVRADGTAFGVIADNTWEMTLAISDTNIVFTSLGGPAFRVLTFEAASPQQAVEQLAALTGKISLPPIWSLGYHQCRYSYLTDTQVEGIADSFRVNKLPCDAIWMDINYMDQYKIFTFSPTGYPNPAALNSFLHTNNFHSVWMIDPGVKQQTGYNIYDQGAAGNYFVKTNDKATDYVGTVWPGNCVFPDFTMPATRTWWSGLYSGFMATGADGIWNDMNEPSVFNGPNGTMPVDNWHRGGGTLLAGSHLRYHNVFGRLMVQASRAGITAANPAKRPFILSRSNFLGGQQYAATWTGDNAATTSFMQLSVPMILTMGLSGQPMIGADVTGYSGSPTPDLVGQWMALGTFYPFYRNHSETGTPMREPWVNGPAIEQVCRTALQRRYRLLPYIYTLTQESTTDGLPIMRPLFFAEPGNASLRSQQQAFLLGDILMVVPKWATGVNSPSGVWTSISLVGEDSKNDPYQPNVLIKAGSILPLGQIIQSTVNYNADSLSLIVSLDANNKAHGINYTDSGEGYSYQSGAYLMREFNIQPLGPDSLILTASVDSGSLSTTTNRYRVGIVTDTGINYTNWTSSNVIKIPLTATGEAPYGGISWPIPGTIQAENYDVGGQGIAYYDTDTANDGGQYRTTESVDVETCTDAGGGYNIGYTATGEWEKYTVNVTAAGTYTLQARLAATTAGNSLHVEIDGVNISGSISVPNTTGFQTWQTASVTTPVLTVGKHIMRIYMETGNFNLNYVTFVLNAPVIPVVTPATLAGTVGITFSYTIAATNSPTSYSVTTGTLPAGLTLNTATGAINGTPTTVGTSVLTVTAINASGSGTAMVSIAIANPSVPVITSSSAANGVINTAFTYTVGASNGPVSYIVTGTFPPGVNFSGTTISGTPTAIGTFIDTLKATNAGGTGVQILTITIAAFAPCSTSMIINATSVPVIDGTVDPVWNNAPKNTIAQTIQGTIQTGSTWQAMYDATNLYVLVQVKDANTSSVGTNVYDKDGVELFIAGNNNKTGAYTVNDHQYRFDWNVAPTTANITGSAPIVTTGITYAIPSVTGGYNLEVAIPWTTIGGTAPTNGKAIGFDININDQQNANTTREAIAGWNGIATDDFSNPADFGTVDLTFCAATAPVITSVATVSGTTGTVFTDYTITATNSPTSYSAGGTLPSGLTINAAGIISGIPTTAGVFIDTVKATNSGGTGTKVLTITILPNAPVITSALTASGIISTAFSYTIAATDTPTSYSVTGSLPAGVTINTSTGVISGIPTASGTFGITINAINAGGTGSQALTITILPNVPVITSALTASGIISTVFSYTITATNTPTSYSVTGSLPAGVTINTSTGVISGIPTASGTFGITINAINAGGTGSQALTITILPNAPVITSATTVNGIISTTFNYTVTATNAPVSYSETGSLPSGVMINTATGVISGTPTVSGTFTITIKATNAGGTGTQALTITILPNVPVITSSVTANGTVGAVFNYTIIATNTPASYSVTGTLPSGVSITGNIISGTPSAPGTFNITLNATNTGGTGTQTLTIIILPNAPVITSTTTAGGTIGTAFSYAITATNTPTSYAETGALPAGIIINTTTGIISGNPTTFGAFAITIKATNTGGTGSQSLTITVLPNAPVITSATAAGGTIGTAFNYTITATNTPTSYSVTGALPSGVTINNTTGLISGTPTASGTFTITLNATNTGGTGTESLTITILPNAPVITSSATANGTVGTAISYTIVATNAPTSYSVTGTLPAGLALIGNSITGTSSSAGTFTVTLNATNAGGSGTQSLTITILPNAPVITSSTIAIGTEGTAFNYAIGATNTPTSYSETGALPAGVTINTLTGVISGTPTASGTFAVTINAANTGGTGTQSLIITITAAIPGVPVITSATTAGGTISTAFSYTIIATNTPTGYSVTGALPAGITINTTTGVISGTPTTSGTFTVTLNAMNAGGTGTQTLPITILPNAPVITSSATAGGTISAAFSYTITATNIPVGYSVTGTLPAGISVTGNVISGTPSVSGTFTVTLNATNAGGTGTQILLITILPNVPVIISAPTANGTTGTAFSYTILATNTPISYAETGALPAGITINAATGIISGTPTVSGTFAITIKATNTGGTGTQSLTITILPNAPVITSATIANGTINTIFNYAITATNTPVSYSETGALPAGITINTATGVIGGTPTVSGTFAITLNATNAGGTGTQPLTITILPNVPVITSSATVNGTIGTAFSYTIVATNMPGSYSVTGTLPAGLALTGSSITGTPSSTGTFIVTLNATNAGGAATQSLTITIHAAIPGVPVITSATTANGTIGTVFNYAIIATNTPAGYSETGALPAGVTINTTTGVISGTPTASGSFIVTLTATNAGGTGTQSLLITILPNAPVITSASTVDITIGSALSYTIVATNTPTSYSAVGLSGGLVLNTSTGIISGTATITGTFTDTIKATNSGGTGIKVLTVTVSPVIIEPVITSSSNIVGTVNEIFTDYSIVASNNPTGYSITGILPAGLIFSGSTISGTPATQGVFVDTLRATNGGGTGITILRITINPSAPVMADMPPAKGMVGTTFNYPVQASNEPTSYQSTTLPEGLNMDPTTGVISGTPMVAGIYTDTVSVANAGGTTTKVFIITVEYSNVILMPNPVTQGYFILSLPDWDGETATVEIRNFIGALLQVNTFTVINGMITVNVPNLIAGNYIAIVRTANKNIIKKFIVK